MATKDYYEILGITDEEQKLPNDKFQEICKKKYRNLSLRWHPDRWTTKSKEEQKEAEDKFKEISEAYSVLSDENKRRQYDNGGMDGFDFNGFDPFEMFRNMNMGGSFNPFGGFGSMMHENPIVRGSDCSVTVKVTFDEAFNGGKKTITYQRTVPCSKCNGTGSSDGKKHTCSHCNGSGRITSSQTRGNMFFQNITVCPYCEGTGQEITNKCSNCGGKGYEIKYETITIDIPSGIDSGMKVIMKGLGGIPNGDSRQAINGDLYVTFNVEDDKYFERVDQINVVHYEEVPFNKALLGCEIECKAPNGTKVNVKVPELTPDGKAFFFGKMGFPDVNGRGVRGDYAVVIKHKLPQGLTKEQREALKKF